MKAESSKVRIWDPNKRGVFINRTQYANEAQSSHVKSLMFDITREHTGDFKLTLASILFIHCLIDHNACHSVYIKVFHSFDKL